MSAEELEDLKATLKSLVVSCPTSMDVRALARDYREMNGEYIPYAKYGYKELLTFLKERCIDCFLFSGHPANPTITPIISDRTKHMNILISKQRNSSKDARYKVKRTSVLESQIRSRYDANKRRSEVNTVPRPLLAARNPISQVDNRYFEKPIPKLDHVKYVDKRTESSDIKIKNPKSFITKYLLPNQESINSGKDFQTSEVKIVRGGELRSIENQLLQDRNDKECIKGRSDMKHVATISDRPTLNELPRFIQKNAVQNDNIMVSKRAITKEPPRKGCPTSSKYVQKPTLNALPQFIQKNTVQKDIIYASQGAIPKEHPRDGHLASREYLKTAYRRSPETTSTKESSCTGYNPALLEVVKSQLGKLLDSNPDGIWLEELEQIYNDMFGSELEYKRLGHVSLESLCGELGDLMRLESVGGRNKKLVVPAGRPASPDSLSPSLTQHAHSRYNVLYLNGIKSQIQEMLDSYPEGVWLQELAEVYRDMFGCDLDYKRLGHASLESLCGELGDVLRLENAGGLDRLAVAAGQPSPRRPPAPPAPRPAPPRARRPRHDDTDELSGDSEDALAGMPYDEGIFPEDCMDRLQSIPRLPAAALAADCVVEVLVSEVLDPSHFWFQLRSEQHDLALNALMDEMTEYYTNGAGRDRGMQFGAVQVGQYCATKFDVDGWHRSVIVQLIGPDSVKVRHVDYGSVITVGRKELRYLRKEWAALPAQAMRGCLAQLRPAGGASCWMHSAARRFLELVNNRPLVAEIYSVDPQAQVVRMFLADTTSDEDVYINRTLVDENCASYVDFKTQTLGDFLLPSFDDVENGKALNYGDKCDLMRSGIFPEGVEHPFSLPVAVVRRDDAPPPASPPAIAPATTVAAPTCGRSATSGTRIPLIIPSSETFRCNSREISRRSPSLLANRAPPPNCESPLPPSLDQNSPLDCEMDELSLSFSHINVNFASRPESELSCSTVEMNHGNPSRQSWAGWQPQTHEANKPNLQNKGPKPTCHPKLDSEKCQSEAPIPMPADFTHYLNYTPSLSLQNPLQTSALSQPQIPKEFNNYCYPIKKTPMVNQSIPQWPSTQHVSNYPHAQPPSTYNAQLENPQPDLCYQYNTQHYHLPPPAQNYNFGSYVHSTQYPNKNSHLQPTPDPSVNKMLHPTQYPNMNSHPQPTQDPNVNKMLHPTQYPNMNSRPPPTHYPNVNNMLYTQHPNMAMFMQPLQHPYDVHHSKQHPNTPFSTQPIQSPNMGPTQLIQNPSIEYSMQSDYEYSTSDYMRRPDVSSVWDLAKDINILPNSDSIQMALSALDTQYREMKMSIAGVAPPNLTQTRPNASNDIKHNPAT